MKMSRTTRLALTGMRRIKGKLYYRESPSSFRYNSCERKVPMTESIARLKAVWYDLEYYKCDFCNGYHLTKQRNR